MTFGEHRYSAETARKIDDAVRALIDTAFASALQILQTRRALLDIAAARLLDAETLNEGELRQFFAGTAGTATGTGTTA